MAIQSASAEVFTWAEGSALFWTGNSTTSAQITYARNLSISLEKVTHSYRPPYAGSRTYIELGRRATLSLSYDLADKNLAAFLISGTGGQYHAHLPYVTPGGASAGIWLWTGIMDTVSHQGSDGSPAGMTVNGTFEFWTVY